MTKNAKATILTSVMIYAAVMGVNFDPKVRAKFAEAFGDHPLGLPVMLVVPLVETVLYLPFLWVVWHFQLLAAQWLADCRSTGRVSLMWYCLTVGSRHPHLRRSRIAVGIGLAYYAAITGTWIAYTAAKGV